MTQDCGKTEAVRFSGILVNTGAYEPTTGNNCVRALITQSQSQINKILLLVLLIIMEIRKAPTLQLKALNKHISARVQA